MVTLLVVAAPLAQAFNASMGWGWPARPDTAGRMGFIAENLAWDWYWYSINPVIAWPRILALMLVGLLIERAALIARLTSDHRLGVRVLLIALALAVVFRLGLGPWMTTLELSPRSVAGFTLGTLSQVSAWPLSAAYAVAVFLSWGSRLGRTALMPLTFVGRMAFTNYLLQSMIAVPLCLAFGLFDRVPPSSGVAIALGIGIFQAVISNWWLTSHAVGPFEWIWRKATYGASWQGPAKTTALRSAP
jgi:uncharacterized protein